MCEFIGLITLLTSKATFIGSVFSSLHSCVPTCIVRAEDLYSATVWFAGHENQSNVCQRISLYTVGPMFSSQGKTVTPFLHCISLRQLQPHDSWHYVSWMSQRICKYKSTFFDKKKKKGGCSIFSKYLFNCEKLFPRITCQLSTVTLMEIWTHSKFILSDFKLYPTRCSWRRKCLCLSIWDLL